MTLVVGCGRSGNSAPEARSPSESVYVVRAPDEWALREAANPRSDNPVASAEPSLDWYAEYERFPGVNHSQQLRVSGHAIGTRTLQRELRGFAFSSIAGARWPAVAGTSSDPAGPTVVLFEVDPDYTLMTLSHEVGYDEQLRWSALLRPVDEHEWVAQGGIVER